MTQIFQQAHSIGIMLALAQHSQIVHESTVHDMELFPWNSVVDLRIQPQIVARSDADNPHRSCRYSCGTRM